MNQLPITVHRKIWVTFQKYGIHNYPSAPEDVSYLRHPHRHLFKFKVTISVEHDDREIEFHQLLNYCLSLYNENILVCAYKSCEMLAEELLKSLVVKYETDALSRSYEVEVSEDGECGAIVTYAPFYQ